MDNLVLLCRHHHHLVHEGGCSVQMSDQGSPEFTDAAGCKIPQVGEKSFRGNVFTLARQHRESGLGITPETTVSLWEGEKMDMNMAIEGLLWRKSSPEQPTSPELDLNRTTRTPICSLICYAPATKEAPLDWL